MCESNSIMWHIFYIRDIFKEKKEEKIFRGKSIKEAHNSIEIT